MNIQEIAQRLTELCRRGEWKQAQQELYHQDVISVEPYESPGFPKETKGLDAIFKKADTFDSMVEEMHNIEISEPLIADNSFAITMTMDAKMKGREREAVTELCVYEVKDGKIIAERFFM